MAAVRRSVALTLSALVSLTAGQKSVYLHYDLPSSDHQNSGVKAWFNTVQPKKSAESTGYAALDHDFGYVALQQNEQGYWKQGQAIFAMWDPACRDIMGPPDQCPPADRGVVVEVGKAAVCERYGFAGTGTKCTIRYNDITSDGIYSFFLEAFKAAPGRVRYEAYFHAASSSGVQRDWELIGKLEIAVGNEEWFIHGLSSFTEVWDGRSPLAPRHGYFGPTFVEAVSITPSVENVGKSKWQQIHSGRASFNPAETDLDVKVSDDQHQWALELHPSAPKTTELDQKFTVDRQKSPRQLRELLQLRLNNQMPGGCLAETCPDTARRMMWENMFIKTNFMKTVLLGIVGLVILCGIIYGAYVGIRSLMRGQAKGAHYQAPGGFTQGGVVDQAQVQMKQMQQYGQQAYANQPLIR